MKTYIIHSSWSQDRDALVKDIQTKIGAKVVEAVWLEDRVKGCALSHLQVASLAQREGPNEDYLVFEDDCVLSDDFDKIYSPQYIGGDIVYFGYNDKDGSSDLIYGTHAVLFSPKARDILLQKAGVFLQQGVPFDHLLYKLSVQEHLSLRFPPYEDKERYCMQKKGLISTITGSPRQ